jgi:hypothetical protein
MQGLAHPDGDSGSTPGKCIYIWRYTGLALLSPAPNVLPKLRFQAFEVVQVDTKVLNPGFPRGFFAKYLRQRKINQGKLHQYFPGSLLIRVVFPW